MIRGSNYIPNYSCLLIMNFFFYVLYDMEKLRFHLASRYLKCAAGTFRKKSLLTGFYPSGNPLSWISFSLNTAVRCAFAPAHFVSRSPGFTRPEIRSWIVDVHKVWYSVSNFYSKNSPLHQPCSHGAFVVTQPRTKSAIVVDSTKHL